MYSDSRFQTPRALIIPRKFYRFYYRNNDTEVISWYCSPSILVLITSKKHWWKETGLLSKEKIPHSLQWMKWIIAHGFHDIPSPSLCLFQISNVTAAQSFKVKKRRRNHSKIMITWDTKALLEEYESNLELTRKFFTSQFPRCRATHCLF